MKNFSKFVVEKASDAGYPVDTDSFSNDIANPKEIISFILIYFVSIKPNSKNEYD